jgi:hypothetical protein
MSRREAVQPEKHGRCMREESSMHKRFLKAFFLAGVALAGVLLAAGAAWSAEGTRKASTTIDGIWTWTLPDTPNGLTPTIAWSGAASSPTGDIYIAGSDHVTNSALYRLRPGTSPATLPGPQLSYVGDAKAASLAVSNWADDDVAEKFHTRPLFHEGKVYVATLNFSRENAGYLRRNGFHWYAYDTASGSFSDLSASAPNRTGAERGGLVAITRDPLRDIIYGAMSPTGDIYALETNTLRNRRLGRIDYGKNYLYPGRAMWTDRRGRVYFSAGHKPPGSDTTYYNGQPFQYIHYYDPVRGFGDLPSWRLNNHRAIDMLQCFPAANTCYLADDTGHMFRFVDPPVGSPTWAPIGNIGQKVIETYENSWVFQVSADRKTIYLLTKNGTFMKFDVASATRTEYSIGTYDPTLKGLVFYGHDAWDLNGRFYVAAFPTELKPGRAKLLAIDPVRFLAAVKKRQR